MIETVAEVKPFSIVANEMEAFICLRLIVAVVGKMIVEATWSTKNDAEFPFRMKTGLVIVEDLKYSYILIVTVSV